MKSLYESLLTGKVSKPSTHTQPSSKEELEQLISEHIGKIKPHPGQEVDFNWIDIRYVDDLSGLFEETDYIPVIDKWKIDHVKNFVRMFAYNRYIVHSPIPVLQKKLLAPECYRGMFWGCTALKVAPELPAKQLMSGCYSNLFRQCRSLKRAPQLPAKQLCDYCYMGMFHDCSSLVEPPELPAKELAEHCYVHMFKNCGKLETKAKVPVEVRLDAWTASGMYAGCTNIK